MEEWMEQSCLYILLQTLELNQKVGMPKLSKFKVVLVGDQNVGKTSIISRFIHDNFEQSSNPTVGIDFVTKTMQVDGETLRLQLWDTAGQERFRSLIPSYVRDADCCLIVLDVSSKSTMEGIDKWHDFVRDTRGQDGLVFLVGNKMDLEREVDKKEAESFAQKNGISYVEVSAKNATNISLLFRKVAQNLIESKKAANTTYENNEASQQSVEVTQNVTLTNEPKKGQNAGGCKC